VIGVGRQVENLGLVVCLNMIPVGWPAAHLVIAQSGERVGGALRAACPGGRPELGDQLAQRRLGGGPWQLAGANRGQAAQRQQHQQRLVR
jgi:hypothetical protein